jgi:hypothetical protein
VRYFRPTKVDEQIIRWQCFVWGCYNPRSLLHVSTYTKFILFELLRKGYRGSGQGHFRVGYCPWLMGRARELKILCFRDQTQRQMCAKWYLCLISVRQKTMYYSWGSCSVAEHVRFHKWNEFTFIWSHSFYYLGFLYLSALPSRVVDQMSLDCVTKTVLSAHIL